MPTIRCRGHRRGGVTAQPARRPGVSRDRRQRRKSFAAWTLLQAGAARRLGPSKPAGLHLRRGPGCRTNRVHFSLFIQHGSRRGREICRHARIAAIRGQHRSRPIGARSGLVDQSRWAGRGGRSLRAGLITAVCGTFGFVSLGFLADGIGRKPTVMLWYAMCLVLTPIVYLWGANWGLYPLLVLVGPLRQPRGLLGSMASRPSMPVELLDNREAPPSAETLRYAREQLVCP